MTDPASLIAQTPTPDPAPSPASVEPSLSPSDTPKIPEGLDNRFWDAQNAQVNIPDLVKSYSELNQFKTEAETQRAAREAFKPEDYKPELPEGFTIPDEVKAVVGEIKIDPKDPRLPAAREMAKELGLDQAGFSKMLALDAKLMIADHTQKLANQKVEMGKLGANGPQRLQAVQSYLQAGLSKEKYEALRPAASSALAVEALEDLIAKANGGQIPAAVPTHEPVPEQKPLVDRMFAKRFAS